jgi:hypothetical protein
MIGKKIDIQLSLKVVFNQLYDNYIEKVLLCQNEIAGVGNCRMEATRVQSLLFPTPQISAAGLLTFFPTVPEAKGDGCEESVVLLMIREEVLRRVSSASTSIRFTRSSHVGIS